MYVFKYYKEKAIVKKIYNNNYTLQPQCDWHDYVRTDSPTIVQIGAHDSGVEGEEYGLQELLTTKNSNVILIEPVPEFFDNLKHAYSQFENCNICFENSAITSTTGTIKIKKQGVCSQISDDGDVEVQSLSWLDLQKKYNLTKIDCLLVDCEGYEETILTELIDYNTISIPLIRFEYMHIQNKEKVVSYLQSKGYTLYYCMWDPTYNFIAVK